MPSLRKSGNFPELYTVFFMVKFINLNAINGTMSSSRNGYYFSANGQTECPDDEGTQESSPEDDDHGYDRDDNRGTRNHSYDFDPNTPYRADSGSDSSKSPSCYIATAVYGDINHPQVVALRSIRDNKLSKSSIGKSFVSFYYSGFGKRAASLVDKIPGSRYIARKTLDLVVEHFC